MNPIPSARALATTIRLWRQRAASRRLLAAMDARGLADIGVSSGTAAAEAGKPFWRP